LTAELPPFDANYREVTRMTSYEPVSGIVLAGGRSRRMGGLDKRWAIVDGRSLLERAIRSLQHWCDEVLVIAALGEELTLAVPGVRVVNDRFAAGPLGGLEAGLRSMRSPCAVVVACDMPFLDSRLLQHLSRLCDGYDAVVPIWDKRSQPLHAVYAASCLEVIDKLLGGQVVPALNDLLGELSVRFVGADALQPFLASVASFTNINTQNDLAAARARSRKQPDAADGTVNGPSPPQPQASPLALRRRNHSFE